MLMKMLPGATVMLLALAGCATNSSDLVSRPAGGDSSPSTTQVCDADRVTGVVGQKVGPELVERARQQAGAETARALRPTDVITMEYNPQRLNLRVDEQDIVTSVNCS